MRKSLLFLLFFPFAAGAQRIVLQELDASLKKRLFETSYTLLRDDKDADMELRLKAVGHSFFVVVKGQGLGAATIQANDIAIFLLDNDSTVKATSIAAQTYEVVKEKPVYTHEYSIPVRGLELLSQHSLKAIRKYSIKGYTDIDIPLQYQSDLRKSTLLFLSELAKAKLLLNDVSYANGQPVNLEDVSRYIGDSITVCGKVFNSHYLRSSANKPVLLNIGTGDRDLLTVVIYDRNRRNFKEAPEKYLLDKDICITGRIELHNNRPQIVIQKEQDISFKTPSTITNSTANK